MVYYSLITGLGLTVIGKSYPSILRAVLYAVRGKISQLLDEGATAPIKILKVKNA